MDSVGCFDVFFMSMCHIYACICFFVCVSIINIANAHDFEREQRAWEICEEGINDAAF